MNNALIIDSSPNTTSSVTRALTNEFEKTMTSKLADARVTRRDLGVNPPPHLDAETIGAFFTPPDHLTPQQGDALTLSDELIDEFLAADVIVMGVPMHNLGITSALKTYIDHIVRVGRTFIYTEEGAKSLVPDGKKLIVLTARGGVYSEGPAQSWDMQENYIRTIFGFIGITDLEFIHCEGIAISEDMRDNALASATTEIAKKVDAIAA